MQFEATLEAETRYNEAAGSGSVAGEEILTGLSWSMLVKTMVKSR